MAFQPGNKLGGSTRKRRLITDHLERELLQAVEGEDVPKARKIAQKVVDRAVAGDAWAIQFVTERTEGRPDQHVSITRSVQELSDADLADIALGSRDGTAQTQESASQPSSVH